MNKTPTVAGILRRVFALVYDLLLLLGISFAYAAIVMLLRKSFGADTMEAPENIIARFIILSGWFLCCAGFFSWCWLRSGQTLGMKSWRIQLQTIDGSNITWQVCARRCLIAPWLIGTGGIGFLWCLINKNGDSLQDQLTGTRVYLLPKGG